MIRSGPAEPGRSAPHLCSRSRHGRSHVRHQSRLLGTSPQDVNQAIRNGIRRAHATLRNLDWFELVEVPGAILDGEVNHYQVTLKVGFRLEDTEQ